MKMPDLQRLGIPGIVGLAVMLFNFSFYLGSVAPDRETLASLQQQRSTLLEDSAKGAGGAPDMTRRLPSVAANPLPIQIPELLRSVYLLATQRGLVIERATYGWVAKEGSPRVEINLPMQASYLALRSFLTDVQELSPSPSLDELTIKRQLASDTLVDANIRLSWRLAATP